MANSKRNPSVPFNWVSPVSQTSFKNYVQRTPPPKNNPIDDTYNSIVRSGIHPFSHEEFTRGMTKDVPSARRLLRHAADIAIGSYGITDERTRRILDITGDQENEDAYLRDVFVNGEVDKDRIEQSSINRNVDRQLVEENIKRDKSEQLRNDLEHMRITSNPEMNAYNQDDVVGNSISPNKNLDADNRTAAEAYLNLELKDNPKIYTDIKQLNDRLIEKKVPVSVREHAIELAKGRQSEDIASAYFNEIRNSPDAIGKPEYYTADVAGLGYDKIDQYTARRQHETEVEASNKLSAFKEKMDAWKKQNMPLASRDPFLMSKLNNEYNKQIKLAQDKYNADKEVDLKRSYPITHDEVKGLQAAMRTNKVYEKSPEQAATFLKNYHDHLLEKKLLEKPDIDRELFEDLWNKTATEVVHTDEKGHQTKLGLQIAITSKRGLLSRLGSQSGAWSTSFGLNSDNASKASQKLDEANQYDKDGDITPSIMYGGGPAGGMINTGRAVYEDVKNNYHRIIGSIGTLMESDAENDREEARIKEKLARKVSLTFDERQFMDATRYKESMHSFTGRDDAYYAGGEGVTAMIPYTLQFVAGNKAMSLAGFTGKLAPVFRAAEDGQVLTKMARFANVFKNFGVQMAQTAGVTTMFPQMGQMNTNRRMYSDLSTSNADGSYDLKFTKNDPFTATVKGYSEALIDNYTEALGVGIDRGFVYAGKGLKKGAVKVGLGKVLSKVDNVVNKLPMVKSVAGLTIGGSVYAEKNASKGVREMMKLGRMNGTVGEYLEEEASRNLNAVILGDNDGKLQFADSEFLKSTGSSVLAYSMLSGGLFAGIDHAGRNTKVRVPVYDANGRQTSEETLKVSKKALGLLSELNDKGELTPESVASVADKFKGKNGEYIQRYGQTIIDRNAEKQEVVNRKDELIQQGLTEEQVDSVQSIAQAKAVLEYKDMLDGGYATINDQGYVVPNFNGLNTEVKSLKEQKLALEESEGDPVAITDLEVRIAKLNNMKRNAESARMNRAKENAGLNAPKDVFANLEQMNQLTRELASLNSSSATHDNNIRKQEISDALSVMNNHLQANLENDKNNDIVDTATQVYEQQQAKVNELEDMTDSIADDKQLQHSQVLAAEKAKLESMANGLEVISDMSNQIAETRKANQTAAERDQALEAMQEQENNLSNDIFSQDDTSVSTPQEVSAANGEGVADATQPVADIPIEEQQSNAIPDGPLLLNSMVEFGDNGKVKGSRKAVQLMLEKSLDLPDGAKVKVSLANGTVTATVSYNGSETQYALLQKTDNGIAEVDKVSLLHTISSDLQKIDTDKRLREKGKELSGKVSSLVDDPELAFLSEITDRNQLRSALLEVMDSALVSELMVDIDAYMKKNSITLGETLYRVVAGFHQGYQMLDDKFIDGFVKSVPLMLNQYKEQVSNSNSSNYSSDTEGTVAESSVNEPKNSEESVKRVTAITILQTVNAVENTKLKDIAKGLEVDFAKRRDLLQASRQKQDQLVSTNEALAEVDKVIGDQQVFEQQLLQNIGTAKEYGGSHQVYVGIKTSRSTNLKASYAQVETLSTFKQMGLLTAEEIATANNLGTANEAIHKAVLRLYALMLGNGAIDPIQLEKLKEHNRFINKQRTNAMLMDKIELTANAINRMVDAYNVRYALSINGSVGNESDEQSLPTVSAIAGKVITGIEEQVQQQLDYYHKLSQHNEMLAVIPDYDEPAPKKPKVLDLNQTSVSVDAIVAYAIRLNGELYDDATQMNREINDVAGRLSSSIKLINGIVDTINKERKKVSPMIGGLSIDSPQLVGDTLEDCLDSIIGSKNENVRTALMLKNRLFGNPSVKRMPMATFDQLLNQHGLNHNTVAFYNEQDNTIYLNEETGNHEHALLHELTHALTVKGIRENPTEITKLFNELKNSLTQKGQLNYAEDGKPTLYGFTSPEEFIAEYFGNGSFAKMVNEANSPSSTAGRIVGIIRRFIRRMVGLPEAITIHDRIIFLTNDLTDRSELLAGLVSHEDSGVANYIYALESQGTPSTRDARKVLQYLMQEVDRNDSSLTHVLSYIGYEDRIINAVASNPSLVVESYKRAGIELIGDEQDAVKSVLDAMREDSLFRYQVISYRIRNWKKEQLEQRREYEAADGGSASSSEDRLKAQQKAFNPIVKNIAKMTDRTRESVELELMGRMKQKDVLDAIADESNFELWLEQISDPSTVSVFDKSLGMVLQNGWGYADFKSAVSFYNSLRNERHIKIMFDSEGNAIVDTVNNGSNLRDISYRFSNHVTSFVARKTIFPFGNQDGKPTPEVLAKKKSVTEYKGIEKMMEYVKDIRASINDDYANKRRTTRTNEYQRELEVLRNLTGIDENDWDMLLSSEGYDAKKVISVGGKRYANVQFSSYKDFCQKIDALLELFSDGVQRTVDEVEQITGVKFLGLKSSDIIFINDSNAYYYSENYKRYQKDSYPCSKMTNGILSKLSRTDIVSELAIEDSKENSVKIATHAMVRLRSLFMGQQNEQQQAVRSNLDALASAIATKNTITSSGFGVDNNRISGMVLNSSMHHIADDIRSLDIRNGLTNFYMEQEKDATPVVLNGMVDLTDRDNPYLFDELNNRDYWKAQVTLFVNGENSYYASMGVFSDKGRGLFIEAPKYGLTWNEDGDTIERKTYNGNIEILTENQVFVFGSNPEGRHGKGSALLAKTKFGAQYGKGRGLQGQSYALVTKNLKSGYVESSTGITYEKSGEKSVSKQQIKNNITELYNVAKNNPTKEFLVAYGTGTNLNGYTTEELAELFRSSDIPSNIVFEKSFNNFVFSNTTKNDFAEHDELVSLLPNFDASLKYFLDHYAFNILPKTVKVTSDEERRICTEFYVSFIRNIVDINQVFQGDGYKSLTDMVKRGAPVISPGYNPMANVAGGLDSSYTHMVISDIINTDELVGEYELANGIQFATRDWFDRLTNSVGEVYANTQLYGKLSSTKALTTGINRQNGLRFLTKTNIVCIDEMADRLGGRWALLRDFMQQHGIDTVSSPSGTKKNAQPAPKGTTHLQKSVGKDKFDGAFNLFELEQGSYNDDDVKNFIQTYYTNDLYVQQDLRHEAQSGWSKLSKQNRMNTTSIETWAPIFESLINSQVSSRVKVFNMQYGGAISEQDKKLVLVNAILDRSNFLQKPIGSMDDLANALSSGKYKVDEEDQEQLIAIMNPEAQLSYPSIARWVRSKLSSAIRRGAIEVKVNRTATQELPDLNEEHKGYAVVDNSTWSLAPYFEQAGVVFNIMPSVALAEASTSDGDYGTTKGLRGQKRYRVSNGQTVMHAVFAALNDAVRFADMHHLNTDGSLPEIPAKFDGTIPSTLKLHELRYEQDADGSQYVVVPGEPFITNRVPGSSLVSHSVVRLKHALQPEVNYTIINIQAQLASGSDFDGDARYNQLMQRDKMGKLKFDGSLAGVNNQMVLVVAEAYSRPENYDRITRPLDVDYANNSVNAIRTKRLERAPESEKYGLMGSYHVADPIGYEDARIKNAAGVTMKAIMANLNSSYTYLKYAKVSQKSSAMKKMDDIIGYKQYNAKVWESVMGDAPIPTERFEFGGIINDRYDIIKKVIENELNKAFDNAKDPKIEDQGITEVTANIFVFMLSTSKKLSEIEPMVEAYMESNRSWADKKIALDRFFKRASLEADAIFNYLNTPIVQDYIRLSRSSTVGNFISRKKIQELLAENYKTVKGGKLQLDMLQALIEFSNDFTTVQKAVNASDTNMGTVSDFIDSANATSSILSNKLSYFDMGTDDLWSSVPSWLQGSMDNISMHAQVLYGYALEYSDFYLNTHNLAVSMVGDGDTNEVTKSMKASIGNGILQALSSMVVYPELNLKSVERIVVSALTSYITSKDKVNAFSKNLMLSGEPGSYKVANYHSSLRTKPTEEELLLAKEAFRKMTLHKVVTINGKKYPFGEIVYLYQLMRYGNQSVKGGFLDFISDETIATYSKKFTDAIKYGSRDQYKKISMTAVGYGAYVGMKSGKVAGSSYAKMMRKIGDANVKDNSFDSEVWSRAEFANEIIDMNLNDESSSLDRIPVSMLNKLQSMGLERMGDVKLTEVLEGLHLQVIDKAVNDYIEKSESTVAISRAKVALELIKKQKENSIPVESMAYNMSEEQNVYGEKTSTKKLMNDGRRTATTRSFPLAYMIGDAYMFNPQASVGRVFSVKDNKDQYFVVENVHVLNVATVFNRDEIEDWSKKEGWTVAEFMKRIAPKLIAGKIQYQTTFRKITPEELAEAKANGNMLNGSKAITELELPEKYRGKLIYATPTTGKTTVANKYNGVRDMDDLIRKFIADKGINVTGLSNMQVGLSLAKMLSRKTLQERQNIIRPLLNQVNLLKKNGITILTGNSFFLEDMPHSNFEGKLKKWVDHWFTSTDTVSIDKEFAKRGEKSNTSISDKLVNREQKAVGDISNQLYPGEYLENQLVRSEATDGETLLDKLANYTDESAQNLITLQELTDRVQTLATLGVTEEDALLAIAKELNCR